MRFCELRKPSTGMVKASIWCLHVSQDDAVLLPFDCEPTADLPPDPSHPHAPQPEARYAIAGKISLASGVLNRDDPKRLRLGEVKPALGLLVGIVVVR